jgi:hypothetical protein
MPEQNPVSGSCLCGGVRFELTPPFGPASFCHCGNCRKHSGHAGSVALKVSAEQLQIVSGSSLYGMNDLDAGEAWVRLGVLEADPGVRISRHTSVASAPAWLPAPEDGLPRYDKRFTG